VIGGGSTAGNPVLATVGGGSPRLERLALSVVGEFDLVVVRGAGGARFLAERGVRAPVAIVPGSVDPARFRPAGDRVYDLAFVGRLVAGKQPLEFVEIAARVARSRGSVRAILLGDGPLRGEVEQRVLSLGLRGSVEVAGQVEDVAAVLSLARLFVLPSLSEGLSIALAEAMTAGAVPLAARVGDLADLVAEGANGYLLAPDDREGFVRRAEALLADPRLWARMSEAASASARAHMGLPHVASLWSTHLREVMRSAGAAVPEAGWAAQRRRA
jgi:glycosyltransferase involved in cell wall biosynthesis